MITTLAMNPKFFTQSKDAHLTTLEQYQLFQEVHTEKQKIRQEATLELSKVERKRGAENIANPNNKKFGNVKYFS